MIHGNKKIINHKVVLLNLAEELGNVSQACRILGLSRDTFYRYKTAVEDGGVDAIKAGFIILVVVFFWWFCVFIVNIWIYAVNSIN